MKNKKYFCPMPWINLTVKPDGIFSPCAKYKGDDIFPFNNIKNDIKNDIAHSGCQICWKEEQNHKKSYRQRMIELLNDNDCNTITRLDIKLNNSCNLKCRMCNPYSSNQIEKEFNLLKNKHKNFNYFSSFNNLSFKNKRNILEQLKNYTLHLERIYATGGEPLLNSYFIEFLKYCIDMGVSKNIKLSMSTNAILINKDLLSIFNQFKNLSMTISVDGTENVYEYIRYPANWKILNENIKMLQNEFDSDFLNCSVAIVPQVYNILDITNIFQWSKSISTKYSLEIIPVWLSDPDFLHIKNIPIKLKQKALNLLHSYNCQDQFEKEFVNGILRDINEKRDIKSWNQFLEYTEILDKKRQQSLKYSIPELYKLIR